MHKKLLVISHNCFSKTGSNGRTLLNYLIGWPKDMLAQVYIHAEEPDFEICDKYFCVTDSNVVKSILRRKSAGRCVIKQEMSEGTNVEVHKQKSITKNSVIHIAREIAWQSKLWNRKALLKWIDEYQPEVILFQAGDAAFLFEFVVELSKKYDIPIILYNTEGYYFKENSYLKENRISKLFYPLLHRMFVKSYRKLMEWTSYSIYNCDLLKEDYQQCFKHNCSIIMNGSSLVQAEPNKEKENRIVYAGNLGVGRAEAILEFASVLATVSEGLYLDIYGKANKETQEKFERNQSIRYHGFVTYEELTKIICESEYLLHVENFDDFYRVDLKYAFSTKIADSLATGSCLIVYAPGEVAVCRYLKDKESAIVISDKEKLKTKLEHVVKNDEWRTEIKRNARKLALRNHNSCVNREEFQRIIMEQVR